MFSLERFKNQKCAAAGCLNEAQYIPVIAMFAPKNLPNSESPATATLPIKLCASCAEVTKLEYLVNDKAWHNLSEAIKRSGKPAPDRNRTQLLWRSIKEINLTENLGTPEGN